MDISDFLVQPHTIRCPREFLHDLVDENIGTLLRIRVVSGKRFPDTPIHIGFVPVLQEREQIDMLGQCSR